MAKKTPSLHIQSGPKIDSDIILVYSKSQTPIYNPTFRPLSPDEKSVYSLADSRGQYRVMDLTVQSNHPSHQYQWHGFSPPRNRSWKFSFEKMESLLQEDRIDFPSSGGTPRLKQYLSDHGGIEIKTTWTDIPSFIPLSERVSYSIQRPIAPLKRIIEIGSSPKDQILDLCFGSGTTLVAAHQLDRYWWGTDVATDAIIIAEQRIQSTCNLLLGKDFKVFKQRDILACSIAFDTYRDVLSSVQDIAKLQNYVKSLSQSIINLKKCMNIHDEASDNDIESAIKEIEEVISKSISKQSIDSYAKIVISWLTGWDRLEEASQSFLPQAEMLYDSIDSSDSDDYSPFIIQYCRALENEILIKLFKAYTENVSERMCEFGPILAKEHENEKTEMFVKKLQNKDCFYTLGQMSFILNLIKGGSRTLQNSLLLKDFREFAVQYFGELISDKEYLDQIRIVNSDFRCKAAHPYILDSHVAQRCREKVRQCLNELILNYRHK